MCQCVGANSYLDLRLPPLQCYANFTGEWRGIGLHHSGFMDVVGASRQGNVPFSLLIEVSVCVEAWRKCVCVSIHTTRSACTCVLHARMGACVVFAWIVPCHLCVCVSVRCVSARACVCAPGCVCVSMCVKDYLHPCTLASERAVAVQACAPVRHARVRAGVHAHAHARVAGGLWGLGRPSAHGHASCRVIFCRLRGDCVCVCVCGCVCVCACVRVAHADDSGGCPCA